MYFKILLTTFLVPLLFTTCGSPPKKSPPAKVNNRAFVALQHGIRSQGALASCASFGIIGLIESNLRLKTGVIADFSERFQLRAVITDTQDFAGLLGAYSMRATTNHGIVPESLYPYAPLTGNAIFNSSSPFFKQFSRFIDDAPTASALDQWLNAPILFGSKPQHIKIPIPVSHIDSLAKVPFIGNTPCYTTDNPYLGKRRTLSPQFFAKHCALFQEKDYVYCNKTFSTQKASTNQYLSIIEAASERQLATEIGFYLSTDHKVYNPFFTLEGLNPTASELVGHNTIVLGFISRQEFLDPRQHAKGLLKGYLFDRLALAYNDRFNDKKHRFQPPNLTAPHQFQFRTQSPLGRMLVKEGGFLILRNSWGYKHGVDGHSLMSYHYFLKHTEEILAVRKAFNTQQPVPLSCRWLGQTN